jgi:hypothetical protein
MGIELPSTFWTDPVIRADEDAHTLTVAAHAQPAVEWLGSTWGIGPADTLHTEVPADEPLPITLTF